MLATASDPVVSHANAPSPKELQSFVKTGSREFRLDGVSVFDNGAPLARTEWVREGVIADLAYSRSEALEFGTGARFAPIGDNLLLTGGSDAALGDMVARTGRGLLLTCLWYIREVDPTTLLLTGRHDYVLPFETSQRPLFDLLGTPAASKRHVVFDAGHDPLPRNQVVVEILAWLDRYFGEPAGPQPAAAR